MWYYYVIYGLSLSPAFSCYLSLSILRMLQGKITDELCCLNNPYWTPRGVKRFQKNSAKIVFLVIFSFYRHFSYWLFFCSVSVLQSGMNFTRLVALISIFFGLIIKVTNLTRLPFIADFIKSTSTSLVANDNQTFDFIDQKLPKV